MKTAARFSADLRKETFREVQEYSATAVTTDGRQLR